MHDKKEVLPSQRAAGVLAVVMAVVCLGLACKWAVATFPMGLGGLIGQTPTYHQWCSWHAVWMIAAMLVCFTGALVSYRVLPFDHTTNKVVHAFFHTCAIVLVCIGIRSIVIFHNKNMIGNLASLHSWLGLMTFALFVLNYFGGLAHFGPIKEQLFTRSWIARYLPSHRFIGLVTFAAAIVAMETGIHQKDSTAGCFYFLHRVDTNPAANYPDIPIGCRYSSGIGVMMLIIGGLVAYCLWDWATAKAPQHDNHHNHDVEVQMRPHH